MRNPAGTIFTSVVIFDFRDCWKGDFYYLSVRTFDFYTGGCEGLSGFHAAHDASDPATIDRDYLNIVFTVERLQRGQSFCYFHIDIPSGSSCELGKQLGFCTYRPRMSNRRYVPSFKSWQQPTYNTANPPGKRQARQDS